MKFLRELVEAAHFSTAPVLIQGEPGTGKTLAAHVLHDLQPRLPKGAFVRFDSTQVIESLSVSDLAGHIRGAFTGAITDHKGMLAAASGGTLFFDEVGDLPLPIQAQLLIAIEEKRFRPVGTTEWRETDFRPLFATNRKLLALVEAGQFRKDLYQRVAGQVLFVPPLGERREDILSLARHFVDEGDPRPQTPDIHPALGEFLTQRSYPGNVRELKQLVGRILAQHVGSRSLKLGDIPADERQSLSRSRDDWQDDRLDDVVRRALSQGASLGAICQAVRGAAFRCALDLEKNDVRRAASRLAVSRRTIQRHCAVWRQPEHETST
jgi:DNA-binding NtrC family response regulator